MTEQSLVWMGLVLAAASCGDDGDRGAAGADASETHDTAVADELGSAPDPTAETTFGNDSEGEAADGACSDACPTFGLRRCAGAKVEVCERGVDECLAWVSAESCVGGQVCDGGRCVCDDACGPPGSATCAGVEVRLCETTSAGCLRWGVARACPGEQVCVDGACAGCAVSSECPFVGAASCFEGGARTCVDPDDDGSCVWGEVTKCAASQRCVAGGCEGPICGDDEHACGNACVSDDLVATCGARCSACPDPPRGEATCVDEMCGVVCDDDAHACDGACVADDAVATCGDRCEPCPSDPHGEPTCLERACGLRCHGGYELVGGACAPCAPDEAGLAACPGAWQDEVRLSHFGFDHARTPALVIDGAQWATLVWIEGDGDDDVVWARRMSPGGVWQDEVALSHFRFDRARAPALALAPDGGVIAAWTEEDSLATELWVSHFDVASGAWSTAESQSRFGLDGATDPDVTSDGDGNAWLVWTEGDPSDGWAELYARRYDRLSQTWLDAEPLSHFGPDEAREPQVVIDGDGNAFVVWTEGGAGANDARLWFRRWDHETGVWSEEEDLSHFGLDLAHHPALTVDRDGHLDVAWVEGDSALDAAELWSRHRDAGTGLWEDEVRLSHFGWETARRPTWAPGGAGGAALVAWTEGDPDADMRLWVAERPVGEAFGAEVSLSHLGLDVAAEPSVMVDATGVATVVWTEGGAAESGDRRLWATRSDESRVAWAPEVSLSHFGLDRARDPVVAIDSVGRVLVVWCEGGDDDVVLWARRYLP